MIYELKSSEFHRIDSMLVGRFINLEIKAVVYNNNPGWIFVDDVENPKTAMVWSKGIQGFYFIGQEDNQAFTDYINKYIDEEISTRAKNIGLNYFEFSGTSHRWDETIEKVFGMRHLQKSKQFAYKHKKLDTYTLESIGVQKGLGVRQVDLGLLQSAIGNLDFVESIILEWWDSIDEFCKKGTGYCVVHNNSIVSSCVSSFVGNKAMESHIVTKEEHRKKGYAKLAVNAFLVYCQKHNIEPYWDCMETNKGSRALAEGFGYSKDFEYSLYSFTF